MFALVRHAHAGDKRRWQGPDDQRPLSPRGRQQADGLARNLSGMPVSGLYSSPYLRCLQTVAPLSALLGVPATRCDALRPDASGAGLDRMLGSAEADGAVVCTHGETLNGLLERWRRRGVLRAPERSSTEKGAVWIVETDGPLRTLHYMPPLHIGPALPPDGELLPR